MTFRPQKLGNERVYTVIEDGRCVGFVGKENGLWFAQPGLSRPPVDEGLASRKYAGIVLVQHAKGEAA